MSIVSVQSNRALMNIYDWPIWCSGLSGKYQNWDVDRCWILIYDSNVGGGLVWPCYNLRCGGRPSLTSFVFGEADLLEGRTYMVVSGIDLPFSTVRDTQPPPIHSTYDIRLRWRLPKILFLINRYFTSTILLWAYFKVVKSDASHWDPISVYWPIVRWFFHSRTAN